MRALLLSILGLAASFTAPDIAHACGGCFSPPPVTSTTMGTNDRQVVTDHRMVLSVSSESTTLWDQIRYAGNPEEFIWVLPVADGHAIDIGLADNAFIDALDQLSSPVIISPTIECRADGTSTVQSSGAGGCGGSTFSYAASDGAGAGGSMRGRDDSMAGPMGGAIVGPYAVEILGGGMGTMGLDRWLETNQFVVPDSVRPAVQFYSARNFDFIVMRLRPGFGVHQMQPIRITVHGSAPVLPLRMIAAGVADSVALNLMVLSRESMRAQNFENVVIPQASLAYDFAAQRSNYRQLFDEAIRRGGGRVWITESVQGLASGVMEYRDAGTRPTMDDGLQPGPEDLDAAWMSADAMIIPPMRMDASSLPPPDLDPLIDRRVAFAGLHGFAKLTRMRSVMYASNLDRDLVLENGDLETLGPQRPADLAINPPACPVTMTMTVVRDAGPPDSGTTAVARGCRTTRDDRTSRGALWLVAGAIGALYVRRRRRH